MKIYETTVEVWRDVIRVLSELDAGCVSITEICRKIVALYFELVERRNQRELPEEEFALFRAFIGVDSETDQFPLGDVRRRWSQEALEREDTTRAEVEKHYSPWIREASQALSRYAKEQTF